jgi:hypothetical protein
MQLDDIANRPSVAARSAAEHPVIDEIRWGNFDDLVARYTAYEQEKTRPAVLRRLAQDLDANEQHLSQIKNRKRGIGNAFARTIERKLRLGKGWMDAPHGPWVAETPLEKQIGEYIFTSTKKLSTEEQQKLADVLAAMSHLSADSWCIVLHIVQETVNDLRSKTAPHRKPR